MSFYIIHVNDGTAVKTSRFFIITNKTWDTSIYFYYYFKFEIQKKMYHMYQNNPKAW